MSLAQSSNKRGLNGTVLRVQTLAPRAKPQHCLKSRWEEAHSTNDLGASPALSHHVTSAAARLPVIVVVILHVVPVSRPSAVSQRLLWIDRDAFSGAAQCCAHEARSILDQAIVDKAVCTGQ